jgi:hypothetical protein
MIRFIEEPGFDVGDNRDYRSGAVGLDQQGQAVRQDFPVDVFGPES